MRICFNAVYTGGIGLAARGLGCLVLFPDCGDAVDKNMPRSPGFSDSERALSAHAE